MRLKTITTESFHWKNKNNIYSLLLDKIDSGPFDGGCVVFAHALQHIYGGQIVVLVSNHSIAEHAVLLVGNTMYDADGPANIDQFIKRFEKNELYGTGKSIIGYRPIGSNDLPEAPRDHVLSLQIAKLLKMK